MPIRSTRSATQTQHREPRVYLRPPRRDDAPGFLAAVKASRRLHSAWVKAPSTPALFAAYVTRYTRVAAKDPMRATHVGFLVCRRDRDAPVGVFNFSEIVRGGFQSAYLGYYAFASHAGAGFMSEGLAQALDIAFRTLKLHRVEVNVQPANSQSLALIRRAGFTREGFSRRYVKIAGRWRDHARFALLAEDWRAQRRKAR